MTSRPPPQDPAVETALLAEILAAAPTIEDPLTPALDTGLTAGDFYSEQNRDVFVGMLRLREFGQPVSVSLLAGELERAGRPGLGSAHLLGLEASGTGAGVAYIRAHARRVREVARHRQAERLGRVIQRAAFDGDSAAIAEAVARVRELTLTESDETRGPVFALAGDLTAPPVEWLIDGLLPRGMLALLAGKDKRGKTLLAQEIARAVLTGRALFDQFAVTTRGRVLAAFLDDSLALTLGRLDTLEVRRDPGLYIADPSTLGEDPGAFLARVEAEAIEHRPVLLILDALYLFLPGREGAGNDAALMGPVMRRLDNLAVTTRAALLLVAHDNKAGLDVAGSYVVRARAKTILRLKTPVAETANADDEPTTPRRVLTLESKLTTAASYTLEVTGPGRWRYLGKPRDVRVSDTEALLLDHLRAGEAGTSDELAKLLERRKADVVKALEALRERGLVQAATSKTGRRGAPRVVYSVPKAPERNSPREQNSGAENPVQDAKTGPHLFLFPPTAPKGPDGNSNTPETPPAVAGDTPAAPTLGGQADHPDPPLGTNNRAGVPSLPGPLRRTPAPLHADNLAERAVAWLRANPGAHGLARIGLGIGGADLLELRQELAALTAAGVLVAVEVDGTTRWQWRGGGAS